MPQPYSTLPPGLSQLLAAFETDGLLIHAVSAFGKDNDFGSQLHVAQSLHDVELDRDCGQHCIAFSLLHPTLPIQPYCPECPTLVFAANADLWSYVQCAAPTDSGTAYRSCCSCLWRRGDDPKWCPIRGLDRFDQGYCRAACTEDPTDELCHQLAAGCSHSVWNTRNREFGARACSDDAVRGGDCGLCSEPAWCDDDGRPTAYGNPITTPQQWMDRFMVHASNTQHHQCKFKRSQKSAFVATTHAAMARLKAHWRNGWGPEGGALPWNEVNMYSGPGDGGLQAALMRNLVGVMTMRRGRGDDDIRRIARRLAELGLEVPTFEMDIEGNPPFNSQLRSWRPQARISLERAPHRLRQTSGREMCDASRCTSLGSDCCAPLQLNEAATCALGFTPTRLNQSCYSFREGLYRCCSLT